jgi:hypothetical protein
MGVNAVTLVLLLGRMLPSDQSSNKEIVHKHLPHYALTSLAMLNMIPAQCERPMRLKTGTSLGVALLP